MIGQFKDNLEFFIAKGNRVVAEYNDGKYLFKENAELKNGDCVERWDEKFFKVTSVQPSTWPWCIEVTLDKC